MSTPRNRAQRLGNAPDLGLHELLARDRGDRGRRLDDHLFEPARRHDKLLEDHDAGRVSAVAIPRARSRLRSDPRWESPERQKGKDREGS